MRPYMRAANVTWQGISLHDVKEMDFTPEEFATYALRRGDVLLSEASGSASEVGKPAIWNDEVQDCCFQNTLIRVRAPKPLVPFLHLHFYKDALTGALARAARGVGIHHLGASALSHWEIQLPPGDEQRQIMVPFEHVAIGAVDSSSRRQVGGAVFPRPRHRGPCASPRIPRSSGRTQARPWYNPTRD